MKTCKKCNDIKNENLFSKNKNNKDGLSIYCIECEKLRKKVYRDNNRDKVNESAKLYRKNNPEKYKETIKKYLDKNPHMTSKERTKKYRESEEWREKFRKCSKEFYEKNKEILIKKSKEYREKNKEKMRKLSRDWENKKNKEDGFFRMKKRIRERIRDYMKGENKGVKTKEIIGLDYNEFKEFISSKFSDGMSWENYGKWHLDHIITLCSAKNKEEILILNHYTNLQPLWAEDNLKKGGKI
jgi:hypothetical protein